SAAEFDDLPRTVEVDENITSGVVASFTVNCTTPSSSGLNVTLVNISPTTTFFNSPNALGNGTFQVTLRPGTDLNAREVNQYILTFTAQCPEEVPVTSQLYIQVKKVDRLECDNTFLNTAASPLLIPENVAPGTVIYTVTLKRKGRGNLMFSLENGSVPFILNGIGEVLVPATGLTHTQAGKLFQMNIVVNDGDGRSCHSLLMVQVQPVYHNTVNFTESSKAVSVFENIGPLQTITYVHAHGEGRVIYEIISPSTVFFTINSVTGDIKNTYNIDLDRNPELAQTLLLVRAYNMLHPTDSATITVNITVQHQNLQGPMCSPAIYVAEIPEDSPTGMSLTTLSCVDKDSNNRTLQYQMENSQIPPNSFRMEFNMLQVNTTLDCDSAVMASLGFQYRAIILVTDSGSPQQTTRIPVIVTVSRVNEYKPECSRQFSFSVPENAAFGDFVANVNGTDRDYPFNNIEYSILGAQNIFYIGRHSGNLYVLGPLDYEKRKSYPLTISLKDLDNDVNSQFQREKSCNITINVQNVNDKAPVCKPEIETRTIYSTSASDTSIVMLQCSDEEGSQLTYTIVGGNINGRFRMQGSQLFHNTFSYNRDGIFDPLNYELLVEVTDSLSTPSFSTTAIIIVHVIPWTTTVPTIATVITTTMVSKKPNILHRTEEYWAPDPWFVVVLTFTGILLLSALGLLFWHFCCRKTPTEISQPLLKNRGERMERNYIVTEEPNKDKGKVSAEEHHHFDGSAQDPVTGQYYLYDSSSGARRWI
ncbi:cadherin-related family member 4, partial [Heteronotia binoei]|uniref:cadherin-related family member 4 n=1 Tax=Heteronotia binoei TaxID=13085 RepID=UPI00292E9E37